MVRYIIFRSLMGLLVTVSFSSQADDRLIGLTLLFQSMGREVVVQRVDLDGKRGPVPGAVGGIYPQGGAEMTFMPGDREQGIPQFVEVAWVVPADDFNRWTKDEEKNLKGCLIETNLRQGGPNFRNVGP